jgi:hypothetical protein
MTPTASSFANPIRSLHYYEKSTSQAWLCGASGSTLCNFTATGWQTIGTIQSTQSCEMRTFNNKLLVADGSTNLRSWDGTTFAAVSGSAPKASCITIIGNRVAVNHLDEPDSVYLSKTFDETGWDTTTTAVGLRVGFGDMLAVNGFGVFGTNLIVSKVGSSERRLYRVDMSDATPANWSISLLSANNAAQGPTSMCSAYNNVFLSDYDGFKSVLGVEAYGDLQVDDMGSKVNTLIKGRTCYSIKYIPLYNAVFIFYDSQAFVFTMRQGKPRFTDLQFGQGIIRSIAQAGSTVYLGGNNGVLYKLDETVATDETTTGTYLPYSSNLRSKTYVYAVDMMLRKFQTFIKPIIAAAGSIYIVTPEQKEILVGTIDSIPHSGYLYDATTYLYDLTGYVYDLGNAPYVSLSRNRTRATGLALQIVTTTGRIGLDKIQAEIAILQGGE